MEDWTSLGQQKRKPEFPVVSIYNLGGDPKENQSAVTLLDVAASEALKKNISHSRAPSAAQTHRCQFRPGTQSWSHPPKLADSAAALTSQLFLYWTSFLRSHTSKSKSHMSESAGGA